LTENQPIKVMFEASPSPPGWLGVAVGNLHERDALGDSEPGQGQAAALCSLAKRTLEAAQSRYAQTWLLVRHFAPTAMLTCSALRSHTSAHAINLRELRNIKKTVARLSTA
jgi:hypothetical protein